MKTRSKLVTADESENSMIKVMMIQSATLNILYLRSGLTY